MKGIKPQVKQIDSYRFEVRPQGRMRVPGIVYATEQMMASIRQDASLVQVANVATLNGILRASFAMPDVHSGYGFPIGGVAAFDEHNGVLSPGGVGYDINCGVRLLRTNLAERDVRNALERLASALHASIPSGVGKKGARSLSAREMRAVLERGAAWAVSEGYGRPIDLEVTEEGGSMRGADPDAVSSRAQERGQPQLGSLGSGNHFCELSYVEEVFDAKVAAAYGLHEGDVTLMIHSGSRGLGYQVADDYIRMMLEASQRYKIELPDRQLCATPLWAPESEQYYGAMIAAVNFAFANRQMLMQRAREALASFFGESETALGLDLVYDVSHNIAKWETHVIDGKHQRVCVHRKGATRAFGPGHPDVPVRYRSVGQPVLVPGDMGRYSYVLAGTDRALQETFGSCCHGAGRVLSRSQAKKSARGRCLFRELRERGVFVQSASKSSVAEEMPEAYKDVGDVVAVVHGAGIARKVAKLKPLAVVKG